MDARVGDASDRIADWPTWPDLLTHRTLSHKSQIIPSSRMPMHLHMSKHFISLSKHFISLSKHFSRLLDSCRDATPDSCILRSACMQSRVILRAPFIHNGRLWR
jgi:hypothetical protein